MDSSGSIAPPDAPRKEESIRIYSSRTVRFTVPVATLRHKAQANALLSLDEAQVHMSSIPSSCDRSGSRGCTQVAAPAHYSRPWEKYRRLGVPTARGASAKPPGGVRRPLCVPLAPPNRRPPAQLTRRRSGGHEAAHRPPPLTISTASGAIRAARQHISGPRSVSRAVVRRTAA